MTALGVNVYFYVDSDVSSSPITPPAIMDSPRSGSFASGSASVTYTNSQIFIGGFWINPGAVAVFQDSPFLALFLSFETTTPTSLSGVAPASYPGTADGTPTCWDSMCLVSLGFIDSASIITNVYSDGADGFALSDSVVGELSVPRGSISATRVTVDGSGGFISATGSIAYAHGRVQATVYARSNSVLSFTNTSLEERPPPRTDPLYLEASESSRILFSDRTTRSPLYQIEASDAAAIIETVATPMARSASLQCAPGAPLDVSAAADITVWVGQPTASVSAGVTWANVSGTLGSQFASLTLTSGVTYDGSGDTSALVCPEWVGEYDATFFASVPPSPEFAYDTVRVVVAPPPSPPPPMPPPPPPMPSPPPPPPTPSPPPPTTSSAAIAPASPSSSSDSVPSWTIPVVAVVVVLGVVGAAAAVFVIKRGKSPSKTSDTNTRSDTRRSGDTELV